MISASNERITVTGGWFRFCDRRSNTFRPTATANGLAGLCPLDNACIWCWREPAGALRSHATATLIPRKTHAGVIAIKHGIQQALRPFSADFRSSKWHARLIPLGEDWDHQRLRAKIGPKLCGRAGSPWRQAAISAGAAFDSGSAVRLSAARLSRGGTLRRVRRLCFTPQADTKPGRRGAATQEGRCCP